MLTIQLRFICGHFVHEHIFQRQCSMSTLNLAKTTAIDFSWETWTFQILCKSVESSNRSFYRQSERGKERRAEQGGARQSTCTSSGSKPSSWKWRAAVVPRRNRSLIAHQADINRSSTGRFVVFLHENKREVGLLTSKLQIRRRGRFMQFLCFWVFTVLPRFMSRFFWIMHSFYQ